MRRRRMHTQSPAVEQLETRALLATITVTSAGDAIEDDNAVTLREALQAANTNQSVDGSEAGDGHDEIVFDPSINGVIQINSTLDILESVSFIRNGSSLTRIRGIRSDVGFAMRGDDGGSYKVGFNKVRLTNMLAAISVRVSSPTGESQLAIRNSRIRNNVMGVIATIDTVVNNTEFYANGEGGRPSGIGGALIVDGYPAEVYGSRFINNRQLKDRGGAIYSGHELTVERSLFVGNRAQDGGAIYSEGFDARIANSTFVENSAIDEGGAIYFDRDSAVESSTFVRNSAETSGGGIWSNRGLAMTNSVLAGNFAGSSDLEQEIAFGSSLDWYEARHNFFGTNRNARLQINGGVPDEDGNMVGSKDEPILPQLSELADNGGSTHTMMPLPESPLIDAGTSIDLATDQRGRGFPRLAGGAVDIGAAEVVDVVLEITPVSPTLSEADSSLTTTFDVKLKTDVGESFTLDIASLDGTAEAGSDFVAFIETLSFAGTAGETKQIQLTIIDDEEFEATEHFRFDITGSLADTVFGSTSHRIYIESDDIHGIALGSGTVLISSDDRDAVATIDVVDDELRVTLDDEVETFPRDDVERIEARLGHGANRLEIADFILTPTLVHTGSGNDTITTGNGPDTIRSGAGDDIIDSGRSSNYVNAGSGDDIVVESGYGSRVYGGDGNDSLEGGFLSDLLVGGRGRDTLMGRAGSDSLFGGAGGDEIIGGSGWDEIWGFEPSANNPHGTDGNDTIHGGSDRDEIRGGAGRDIVRGGAGSDIIYASGNIFGGSGDNTVYVTGLVDTKVTGGDEDDTVYGSSRDDTIQGGNGSDLLLGYGGGDMITGGPGRDILVGGTGADNLASGADSDILIAGSTNFSEEDLRLIAFEWRASRNFEVRKANLTDGSGSLQRFNGDRFLIDTGDGQTIFDDNDPDSVLGGSGLDWFFANLDDDDIDGD
ncbi:MAG: choice-of-anchor Q domain-containing protein [Planctomycetaceae bacterium]